MRKAVLTACLCGAFLGLWPPKAAGSDSSVAPQSAVQQAAASVAPPALQWIGFAPPPAPPPRAALSSPFELIMFSVHFGVGCLSYLLSKLLYGFRRKTRRHKVRLPCRYLHSHGFGAAEILDISRNGVKLRLATTQKPCQNTLIRVEGQDHPAIPVWQNNTFAGLRFVPPLSENRKRALVTEGRKRKTPARPAGVLSSGTRGSLRKPG